MPINYNAIFSTARTVADVLKWTPIAVSDNESEPILLKLYLLILKEKPNYEYFSTLLQTLLRILNYDLAAMKEKTKRVRPGPDLIKIERQRCSFLRYYDSSKILSELLRHPEKVVTARLHITCFIVYKIKAHAMTKWTSGGSSSENLFIQ